MPLNIYTSQHFTITEGKKGEQNCFSKMFLASKYNSVRNLLTALHRKRQKRARAKQETERFGVNLWLLLFIILLQKRSSCVQLCPDILCQSICVKIIHDFLNCFSRVIYISSTLLWLKTCFFTSNTVNSRCVYKVLDTESSYLESLILFCLCNSLILAFQIMKMMFFHSSMYLIIHFKFQNIRSIKN